MTLIRAAQLIPKCLHCIMPSSTNNNLIGKQVCIVIYAIFLGSQLAEAFLLVPYWQSLPASEFYSYYAEFGPMIGRFYTVLTIIATIIPISVAARYFMKKHAGIRLAVLSSFFAILVILCFYVYFKSTNAQFYRSAFSERELAQELVTWSYWHWSRIVLEIFSLIFLMLAFDKRKSAV